MYTFIPEALKKIMNDLGFGLGLDREGNFYITDNEFRCVMPSVQNGTNTFASDKVKGLFFNLGNYPYDQETQTSRPIFNMIRVNNSTDNSILEVTRQESTKAYNSFIKIKTTKDFDNNNYEVEVNLTNDGQVEVISSDKAHFYYSASKTGETSTNSTAQEVLNYITESDERIMPIIEYYANIFPSLQITIIQMEKESTVQKDTQNTKHKSRKHKSQHAA